MANEYDSDVQPFIANIMAYGDHINNPNQSSSSGGEYDSDTSLSSTHSEKSIEIKKEGSDDGYMIQKRKSLMKILKSASQSRYNPSKFDEEIMSSLEELDHPPNDKKSFIWGAILMFIASFLFSISTQIIKYNHSFGRESFEIFVFRMFIQLFVTTIVASISVVMNHHYCYESVSMFSSNEEGNNDDTETEYDTDVDAELGQFKKIKKRKRKKKSNNLSKISSILRGQYKYQKPCCQIRCIYTTVFAKFWRECSSSTKLYIVLRGFCGGTGAVCYYWSVAILPINDTIMILSLFPIFSTIFAYIMLGEIISYKHIFYLFIGMCGILLMCYPSFIFGRDPTDPDDNIYNINRTDWTLLVQGYGFAFISSICYGFVFIFIRLAYKSPTFALIFSNGLFGALEAIIICILFKRFVPIPMWRDWLIAIGIGCIGYLAQNAENRSGKYVFASLTSIIRVTDVFWEYVWQNLIYSKPAPMIASIGAGCLAFSIIFIMRSKYNDIKDIEISNALEGVIDYDTQYDTDDINDIYYKKKSKARRFSANIAYKICGKQKYQNIDINDGI